MYPRFRQRADAAAVAPIMKLLVVVEALKGIRIAPSRASTLNARDPIPNRPAERAIRLFPSCPSSGSNRDVAARLRALLGARLQ
jgi:hypothetical protein